MTVLLLLLALAAAPDGPLVVGVGTQATVELPPNARGYGFDLWDEGILDARLVPTNGATKLLIIGNAQGRATLLFFGAKGPIGRRELRVVRENTDLVICDICRLIGAPKDRGTTVRMV